MLRLSSLALLVGPMTMTFSCQEVSENEYDLRSEEPEIVVPPHPLAHILPKPDGLEDSDFHAEGTKFELSDALDAANGGLLDKSFLMLEERPDIGSCFLKLATYEKRIGDFFETNSSKIYDATSCINSGSDELLKNSTMHMRTYSRVNVKIDGVDQDLLGMSLMEVQELIWSSNTPDVSIVVDEFKTTSSFMSVEANGNDPEYKTLALSKVSRSGGEGCTVSIINNKASRSSCSSKSKIDLNIDDPKPDIIDSRRELLDSVLDLDTGFAAAGSTQLNYLNGWTSKLEISESGLVSIVEVASADSLYKPIKVDATTLLMKDIEIERIECGKPSHLATMKYTNTGNFMIYPVTIDRENSANWQVDFGASEMHPVSVTDEGYVTGVFHGGGYCIRGLEKTDIVSIEDLKNVLMPSRFISSIATPKSLFDAIALDTIVFAYFEEDLEASASLLRPSIQLKDHSEATLKHSSLGRYIGRNLYGLR